MRDVLNYYAGAPERLIGAQIPVAGGIDVTFHEPLGVIGVIVPWNFPMTIASWGFAPALAAGNAVLLKPADWTPLTAIRLGELGLESGLPEGLFQVLPGRGSVVGERFVTHPQVHKIVFTGSTEVGKQVAAGCRGAGQAGHARARRQERERGVRRLRPRAGGRDGARLGVRQRRPGLLRPQPHPRRADGARPVPRTARARRRRRSRSGSPATSPPRWARSCRQRTATRCRPSSTGRMPWSRSAGSAPEGPGFWMPPTVLLPASRTDRGRDGGDLRTRRQRAAVRRRGRRHRARERQHLRPVGLDLDERPRPRASASRAACSPATSASTRTRACATRRRSAG